MGPLCCPLRVGGAWAGVSPGREASRCQNTQGERRAHTCAQIPRAKRSGQPVQSQRTSVVSSFLPESDSCSRTARLLQRSCSLRNRKTNTSVTSAFDSRTIIKSRRSVVRNGSFVVWVKELVLSAS